MYPNHYFKQNGSESKCLYQKKRTQGIGCKWRICENSGRCHSNIDNCLEQLQTSVMILKSVLEDIDAVIGMDVINRCGTIEEFCRAVQGKTQYNTSI